MFSIGKKYIERFTSNDVGRYLVAGGCTTLVNLVVFFLLHSICGLKLGISNFISIFAAIVFAFFINKFYAFASKHVSFLQTLTEFLRFLGGRLITMMIEIGGVAVLAVWFDVPDFGAKIMTQCIVVVSNYFISKLFVFGGKSKKTVKDWFLENWQYVVSFVIPAIIFCIICYKQEVTPFGGKTLMIIDSLHQYIPFFSDYYDKLTKSGEFLYSWNGSMGYNFVTLWAYYLSSPFNLIILLFDKLHINTAMTIIIGLKISFSSMTMTYYLTKRLDKKDGKAILFGLCYAYSNYVVGYYWNIMWLDVLLLTPLVLLGLEYLIKKRDARLYIVTLFMSLFCNFYISFMLCIFLVLWFLLYPHKSFKSFFDAGIRFAGSSLLAAGMAAVVLIPTYYGIMLTGPASESEFPAFTWYGKFVDILKKFCMYCGSITNQGSDDGVNLYCGIIVLFLGILYFAAKEIHWFEKIKRMFLIVLFIVSFNNEWLNYVWHGFHNQFGIPNRFSFLLIVVLIVSAHEVLSNIEDVSFWRYWIPMIVLTGIVVYNNEVNALFDDEKIVRMTMLLWILYFMACMLRIILEWKPQTLTVALTILVVIEMTANALISFKGNGQVDIDSYFSDSEALWAAAESVNDGSFYREELSKNHLVDENFWQNLKGVGIFGSTVNGDSVTLFNRLGFYTAANEHLYYGATPLTDALFGVKYLYMRDTDYLDHGFDYLKTVEGIDIYQNPDALSLGYMISEDIIDWNYEDYDSTLVLNDFVAKAAGVNQPLYTSWEDNFTGSGENCEVTYKELGEGTFAYSRTSEGDLTVSLHLTARDNTPLYIRATGTDLTGIQVFINGELQCDGRYFFQLLPVGNTVAGDEVEVKYLFNGSQADDQTVNLKVYDFNPAVYRMAMDQLSKHQLDIESYTSNSIKGTVEAEEDGVLMTTIVNEPGWKVYVDGEEDFIDEIGDSFACVYLEKGKHDIEFKFVPASLPPAAVLSFFSVALFVFYIKKREAIAVVMTQKIQSRKEKKEQKKLEKEQAKVLKETSTDETGEENQESK